MEILAQAMPPMEVHLPLSTYGTFQCGYETMKEAWPRMEHVWSCGGGRADPKGRLLHKAQLRPQLLNSSPVDVIVIDQGYVTVQELSLRKGQDLWESCVSAVHHDHRPTVLIESWPDSSPGWDNGPMTSTRRTRWKALGYETHFQYVDVCQCGGAVAQRRLLVA